MQISSPLSPRRAGAGLVVSALLMARVQLWLKRGYPKITLLGGMQHETAFGESWKLPSLLSRSCNLDINVFLGCWIARSVIISGCEPSPFSVYKGFRLDFSPSKASAFLGPSWDRMNLKIHPRGLPLSHCWGHQPRLWCTCEGKAGTLPNPTLT